MAIAANDPSFHLYSSGIITKDCGEDKDGKVSADKLDHGVLIVGFGRDAAWPHLQYYLVKNSWGTSWGEKGYGRIGINANGIAACGI